MPTETQLTLEEEIGFEDFNDEEKARWASIAIAQSTMIESYQRECKIERSEAAEFSKSLFVS